MDFDYDWYDMEDIPWTEARKTSRELERISIHKYLKDWYVKSIEYCVNCWSVNIKLSNKWNKYCWEICRKKIVNDE